MRRLASLLLIPTLGYAALLTYVYAVQDQLTYQPRVGFLRQPGDYSLPATSHRFATSDGETLFAWHVPAPRENAGSVDRPGLTLIYMHGNGGNVSYTLPAVRELHRLGLGVFVFDYRGYGQSSGQPSEAGLYRDATAAYQYVTRSMGVPPERVLLYGRSLGGGVAGELATREASAGLIIESSFTSAWAVGAELYWYLPVRLLAKSRFETAARFREQALVNARAGDLPVLIVHGQQDRLIPPAHGRELFASVDSSRKTLLEVDGGHNSVLATSRDAYLAGLRDFIGRL